MVMDGQGGGIGGTIIKGLRESLGNDLTILAVGTNSIATSRMMKAGANRGGTGENAIAQTSKKVDVIIGPLSILMANAMMGEVTQVMACAVSSCEAKKVLLPLIQENVRIAGASDEPLPHLVAQVIEIIKEMNEDV
ncbi:MAG: DUF3842 family protein [Desulfobacteraceae bacterium]|nr:MAG: DUF3842 family protein [Desulfobacteraceae bacterium]